MHTREAPKYVDNVTKTKRVVLKPIPSKVGKQLRIQSAVVSETPNGPAFSTCAVVILDGVRSSVIRQETQRGRRITTESRDAAAKAAAAAKKTRTSLRSTAQINYSEMNRGSHNSPTRGENRSIAVGRKRQP